MQGLPAAEIIETRPRRHRPAVGPSELQALATVIVIDLVLAGDNAIVVGMAAAAIPQA